MSSSINVASSSEEVYTFLDLLKANPRKGLDLSSFQPENSVANSYTVTGGKGSDAKPKKRVRSKAGPKSRKKGRINVSLPNTNDEALDSDLFAFVGSLDTNKSLDSDSSTSTLINEEISGKTNIDNKEFLGSNAFEKNFKSTVESSFLKNTDHLGADLKSFTNASYNVNKSIFSSSIKDDHQQNTFMSVVDLPAKTEGISFPVQSKSSRKVEVKNDVSSLNVHSDYSPVPNPFSSSNSHSILRSLITGDCGIKLLQNQRSKSKAKAKTKILPAQTQVVTFSEKNPISLVTSRLGQNDQTANPQSFYASMGLDEDLCDSVSQNSSKNIKTKSITKKSRSVCSPENYSMNAPVKIETDELSSLHENQLNKSKIAQYPKDEMLSSNGLHVTMTFEAEPPCEDEEDDLPLSFLKSHMPANEINEKLKKSQEINNLISQNVDDIHPSMFIKKELIEDEIVSESEAVSSNLLTASNANFKVQAQTSECSSQNDLMNVQIKTEPVDDYPKSDSTAQSLSQHSINSYSQFISETTDSVSGLFLKNKFENRKHMVSKDNLNLSSKASENAAPITKSDETKSLEQFNALAKAQVSELSSHALNNIKNSLDTSITCKKNKTVTSNKKSRGKATKLTRKNVLENSNFYENELTKSLSNEDDQNVQLNSENSSVNSYQQVTDTTDTESNSSSKKGKRKKSTNKSMKIDENVPITLLIKRKKTDPADDGESDSFLYTSVSKSNTNETQFSSNESSDKPPFNYEDRTKEMDNSKNLGTSLVLPKRQTKQTKGNRKRQTKNVPSNNCIPEKRGDTLVIMDFEEQSPVEEISDDLNSTLSVNGNSDLSHSDNLIQSSDNDISKLSPAAPSIKRAMRLESNSEKNFTESICDASESAVYLSTDETLSTLSSVISNSNRDSENSTPSNFCKSISAENQTSPNKAKKKARRRKMNWYKKKKYKTKDMIQTLHTVEVKEPKLDTLKSNTQVPINKVPVVVIKNVFPEIKRSNDIEKSLETNNSLDQELVASSPAKGKKKKGTNSRKRKKGTKSRGKTSKKFQSITPESSTTIDNSKTPDSSVINGDTESTETVVRNTLAETSEPVSHDSSINLVSDTDNASKLKEKEIPKIRTNIEDNPLYSSLFSKKIDNLNPLLHSIQEEEIQQEIVAFEAILQNRGEPFSSKSFSRISEAINYKEPLSQSTASEPNILEAFNSSFKSVESNAKSLFETDSDIQIKKEKDDLQSSNSVREGSFLPNTIVSNDLNSSTTHLVTSEKGSGSGKNEKSSHSFSSNVISSNLVLSNKDLNHDKSSAITKAVEMTRHNIDVNNKMLNLQNEDTNTIIETNSSGLTSDTMKSSLQNPQSVDLDQIALSIKKEVSGMTSSKLQNISFKDQLDLIQKAQEVRSENLIQTHSNLKDTSVQKHFDQPVKSDFDKTQVKDHVDDEIEILIITDQNTKDVVLVDLTDDNCPSDSISKKQESFDKNYNGISVNDTHKSIEQNTAERENNAPKSNSSLTNPENISCDTVQLKTFENKILNRKSIPKENTKVDLSLVNKISFIDKNDSNLFPPKIKDITCNKPDSLLTGEKDERNCPVMIQICNSEFAGDKYINEYFKHPFPCSTVSYNSKQRNKNKIYTRIHSISWNLSIDEVESRLKLSETPQFGKKLGDIVRLEKYPVSISEVECYHRILGVAPSQKLLSKCFKSPEKNQRLNMFLGFQQMNEFEVDNSNNQTTLQDVFKGISETKMMYSRNNPCNSQTVYERECPSTETRDSCDSHVSNTSTSLNAKSSNLLTYNEMTHDSLINNTSSNRGIITSSHSNLNETIRESDLNIIPQSCKSASMTNFTLNETVKSNSTNALGFLNLPTQETINNLLSNTASSSAVDRACDTVKKNFPELQSNSFASNDSYPFPNSCQPLNTNFESNSELKTQNQRIETSNIIDVPVTELRKILETAGNLTVDTVYDQEFLWKSKATYEYNHTHSIPVPDDSSVHDIVDSNNYNPEFASNHVLLNTAGKNSNVVKETCLPVSEESIYCANNVEDDSEDDYVDNEPMTNDDVDNEPMTNDDKVNESATNDDVENEPVTNDDIEENSSPAEEETDKEKVIPQYKSKWEKIIERISLENTNVRRVNPYMLKDCFPVSNDRKKNDNSNISEKSIVKPSVTPETLSAKKVSVDKQKKKKNSVKKSDKQRDKLKTNTKKQEKKCAENPKQKTEKKKTNLAEKGGKKQLVVSKKKSGKVDDVLSLFVPDKPVQISKEKNIDSSDKSLENNKSKRFYGNRVTNRGSFLTESGSSREKLKNIKIPKKKPQEMPKKSNNLRSEEFHSMIKSPVINIDTNYRSSYKTSFNKSMANPKSNEFFRSPLENSVPSSTSHYIRTKKMRDRTLLPNAYQNKFQSDRRPSYSTPNMSPPQDLRNETMGGRRPSLLSTPPSVTSMMNEDYSHGRRTLIGTPPSVSPLINDECSFNRNLSPPPSISAHLLNGDMTGRSISPALTLPSKTSQPAKAESLSGRFFSDLISQPSSSYQQSSSSFQSIIKPENMNILHDILSAIQTKTLVPEVNKNILPFSDPRTPNYNFGELNPFAHGSKVSVKNTVNEASAVIPDSFGPVNKLALNAPSQGQFGPLKSTHPVQNISLGNQLDIPFNSDILHSSQLNTLVNPAENSQVAPQPKKAVCLVPQHLKTLVGHKTIETHNVRLLMLEWSVDWLVQQQRLHDPPPISNALKKIESTYDSFEDYYNTFFPLMLLETWHRIYVSWTHLNQASPYICQIISYSVKQHYVSIECQTVFNTAAHPKGVFPDEGSILMVKYTTKSHQFTIKTLGYVTQVKTRRFNSVTDSKMFSSLKTHKDANPDLLQILTLTFMGAYNSEDIDKREPIRIHVLCNVKPALKQNDALLHINKSPLQRIILNPVAEGLLSHSLTPRNSPLEKINECVREITKGILSPHPLPLLTIVRAKPESDRLNIIPLIIEKMKTAYKTKVLLCVRTVRALGDIAANICLHQSLKMVIINKRCDTNPQFQKYLLDEAATAEISKTTEDKVGERIHIKNEVAMKAKKQILKDCDVVLSLIRNCHDEFLNETFVDTDCVSQMCCIIDEANLCTEPESLIPVLHGISKLILIGDPDYPAKVLSKTANSYDYSQSFFQRAYALDLVT